jgi:hypothetical protein
MLSKITSVVWIAVGLLWPRSSPAEELYAVRFNTLSSINGFLRIHWRDDIVFHNTTSRDVAVRLLGMSNGGNAETPTALVVPANRTVSASAEAAARTNWSPRTGELVPLWVVHLDVPQGVVVQSRAEAHTDLFGGIPPSPVPDLGAFSLPVFRALVPANQLKVHLGADLGSAANPLSEISYTNVGVYNASSTVASATIQLRQACNDALLEERRIAIAPDTIVQVNGLRGIPTGCSFAGPGASSWMKYVTVLVDQPSLSYIVNRKSVLPFPPAISYGSAFSQ